MKKIFYLFVLTILCTPSFSHAGKVDWDNMEVTSVGKVIANHAECTKPDALPDALCYLVIEVTEQYITAYDAMMITYDDKSPGIECPYSGADDTDYTSLKSGDMVEFKAAMYPDGEEWLTLCASAGWFDSYYVEKQ